MGKQVNFFMLPEDEKLFLSFVLQDPEVEVLAASSTRPAIRVIDRLSCLNGDLPHEGLFCFWKSCFPIARDCFSKSSGRQFDYISLRRVRTKTVYFLSRETAPVIEYSPSRIVGEGVVRRGRIWATMNYLQNGAWQFKDKPFDAWYGRIARWLRRNFFRTPDSSFFYLGPTLLALHEQGKVKYKPYELCRPELGEILLEG